MSSELPTETVTTPLTLALQPINATASLRDQAYAMLRQAIADADIYQSREEIRLDERVLSETLGVSRTPVREAMTLLEQEGFLRMVPRRGIYIVRKSKREIVEMIQMWAALESMAARLATLHASDEEIAKLRHMFDQFRDSTPAEHIAEYSDANIAFHQAIVELSKSRVWLASTRMLLLVFVTVTSSSVAAPRISNRPRLVITPSCVLDWPWIAALPVSCTVLSISMLPPLLYEIVVPDTMPPFSVSLAPTATAPLSIVADSTVLAATTSIVPAPPRVPPSTIAFTRSTEIPRGCSIASRTAFLVIS